MDPARDIAIEHVLWAAGVGQTPAQVLASIGVSGPLIRDSDWHDCVLALSIAWRRLGVRQAEKARTHEYA